jgi:hypothetical protein
VEIRSGEVVEFGSDPRPWIKVMCPPCADPWSGTVLAVGARVVIVRTGRSPYWSLVDD